MRKKSFLTTLLLKRISMTTKAESVNAHFFVLLATLLVALSFIVSEKLAGVVDPLSLTLLRFTASFFVLLPFVLVVKRYRSKIKQSFKKGITISFFYSMFFVLLFKSLEYTTALNTATLYTLVPLATAIFSYMIFKEALGARKILIYFLGILGTAIVIFDGSFKSLLLLSLNRGDVIFMFGVILMAIYSVSIKYCYKKDDEIVVITLMTLLGGIIWMSIAVMALDVELQWHRIRGDYIGYLLYLSIGATLATVFLYQKSTIVIGPSKVMAYIYLNPAIVATLLYILESKKISQIVLLGISISVLATYILLKSSNIKLQRKTYF